MKTEEEWPAWLWGMHWGMEVILYGIMSCPGWEGWKVPGQAISFA